MGEKSNNFKKKVTGIFGKSETKEIQEKNKELSVEEAWNNVEAMFGRWMENGADNLEKAKDDIGKVCGKALTKLNSSRKVLTAYFKTEDPQEISEKLIEIKQNEEKTGASIKKDIETFIDFSVAGLREGGRELQQE